MALDIVSVTVLVVVAGLAGVAGYWGRIVQKFEDKRDQIYLTDLPSIYSNTSAFKDALTLFQNSSIIDQLADSLNDSCKNLATTIFSGNILVFQDQLREDLLKFYHDAQILQAVIKQIKDLNDPAKKEVTANNFRLALSRGENFAIGENLETKPKEVLDHAAKISNDVKKRLETYRSYSWKLTIIIFVLAALVASIEIIKGYFSA